MSQTKLKSKTNRVLSFDILRGSMIFYVIFLHALIQRVFSSDGNQFALVVNKIPTFMVILAIPLILLSLWGSIFTFISGASTAYSLNQKYTQDPSNFNKHVRSKIISGIALYVIFMIEKIFFSVRINVHPVQTFSLITGSLEEGTIQWPTLLHLTTSSTLESLVFTSVLISIILYILWKKMKCTKKKTVIILILIGIANLIVTNIFRMVFPEPAVIKENLLSNNQYLVYALYLRLCADRFAHFPVFTFGLFGASISLLINEPNAKKKISRLGLSLAIPLLALFIIHVLTGFDILNAFHEEMVPIPLQYLTLGLQIIVLVICLRVFDFRKKKFINSRKNLVITIQKYSNLSLTIYVLEPLVSQLWYLIFVIMYGGPFYNDLPKIILYIQTCMIVWWFIVKKFAQVNYKYSLEWIMVKIQQIIKNSLNFYLNYRVSTLNHYNIVNRRLNFPYP